MPTFSHPAQSRSRSVQPEEATRYTARNGAIVGHNQGRFFNRPLYVANRAAFVLAGDRPVVRFAADDTLLGTFAIGVTRGRTSSWLHTWDDVTFEYRPAHARWIARDAALPGLTVTLDVVALETEVGFAARVAVQGARAGDELGWFFGGAKTWKDKPLNWDLDPHFAPPLIAAWFDPELAAGNAVRSARGGFAVAAAKTAAHAVAGKCDAPGGGGKRDAMASETPAALAAAGARARAVVYGRIDLTRRAEAHWRFARVARAAAFEAKGENLPTESRTAAVAFADGLARAVKLANAIVVDTPEPRLNAAAATLSAAIDGTWYPPVFRHGAMLWNVPYVGWRTACGSTAIGWHERVKAHARYYIDHQLKESENRSFEADAKVMLTIPAPNSRFHGRGRIVQDQGIYNMQSQFFDQMIHAWRWTGDEELAAWLRPALELHLEWLRECFDPDDDGLYESVINVWPTDSFWYAGGGATEETSYAYRGHVAARALAEWAGDAPAAKRHARQSARIRAAFRKKLWVAAKGHAGLYQEAEGRRRLHDDAWLYSIFLPIDAGLTVGRQAAESLLFAERGLQNDAMPAGGRRVWTSNLVPAIWSVRECWPGDNYHLALAYFQAGMPEDGWDILRGNFLHSGFNQLVPGDFAAPVGGTDFGDCVHMAARALVEGLFGYAPDRPRGIVRITPQFPTAWERASLRTADVTLQWTRTGERTALTIELAQAATLEVRVPVNAQKIVSVTANGRPVRWKAEAGLGRTLLVVRRPGVARLELVVTTAGAQAVLPTTEAAGVVGRRVAWRLRGTRVEEVEDPQRVLTGARIRVGVITGIVIATAGWHTLFARVRMGGLPQWRRVIVRISDAAAERAAAKARLVKAVAGTTWAHVDLAPVLNGDIRAIYAQKYVSPRPATMSARIGTDGYSPWTFPYWDSHPPTITLDNVPSLLRSGGDGTVLQTAQGVPFAWPGEARNVAFTSRWDNWPTRVAVPVGRAAEAAWFLVGGSTNPMQGRIANGVLRLRYASGAEETIELTPPFNYWNLCPIRPNLTGPMQGSRVDYTSPVDAFCVPKPWPETVQLGENCRAILLGHRLRRGDELASVTLETLSAEVVIGLLGVSLMNPRGMRRRRG
ncbi:DUF4450 domain-containing protein [Horticoccus luteus]|uniref:DUF4450 domain-containing protein n=1 Tax=Horticoccus luteus TaxID=2862869 RepID=A0A8F9TWV8_9BACT|nr:DUF4450 domain-containing protein [Horticoccus luteus]QYM79476.1 DUF4450 domain-containing protein [Horticoccus luteus]